METNSSCDGTVRSKIKPALKTYFQNYSGASSVSAYSSTTVALSTLMGLLDSDFPVLLEIDNYLYITNNLQGGTVIPTLMNLSFTSYSFAQYEYLVLN